MCVQTSEIVFLRVGEPEAEMPVVVIYDGAVKGH
jgi:hypothetical protein